MSREKSALISLHDALRLDRQQASDLHRRHLNPRLATVLELIKADKPLERASGARFWAEDGTEYLDFLCGYGTLGLGHNHPLVCQAVQRVEARPNLVQGFNPLAGALAHNLAVLSPGNLQRVFFANSGAEVVDAAIKLARAATGRTRLVACQNGFHGRTIGALSVMDHPDYCDPFAPLLPDISFVPFGDKRALEAALQAGDVAGFLVEPIQGEGGIVVPPEGYLRVARRLCSEHGTLMIADEVQTGLGRTGQLFAVNEEDVAPDVLLLGKVLGGGVSPLSALLTSDPLWQASQGSTARSPFHTSTFGGNSRACAAGLAALEVLVGERLWERAADSGAYLLGKLRELQARQPLIGDVRGRGLMIGIEFSPATRGFATLLTRGRLNRLSHEYMSGLVVIHLVDQHRIMSAPTLINPNVLRLEPPLNIGREDLDYVVRSLSAALKDIGSFTREAFRSWPKLLRVRSA